MIRLPDSLNSSLRILQKYAEISGFNMNMDKTTVVWFGKTKLSQDAMCVKCGICKIYTPLYIHFLYFSIDISEIVSLNFKSKFKEKALVPSTFEPNWKNYNH